jgi:hypothetical protein
MRGAPEAFGPPLEHAEAADLVGGHQTTTD